LNITIPAFLKKRSRIEIQLRFFYPISYEKPIQSKELYFLNLYTIL
jgi:hypothetical protein